MTAVTISSINQTGGTDIVVIRNVLKDKPSSLIRLSMLKECSFFAEQAVELAYIREGRYNLARTEIHIFNEVIEMKQVKIAYQLYSARDEAAKDLSAVLKTLRDQGYEGVEFAGFYGKSADEIKSLLSEHNLQAVSSHVPLEELKKDIFGVISFHQKIGCPLIAIPYLAEQDRPGHPAFAELIPTIYRTGNLCRKAGIQLLYHNHDFEFEPFNGGYMLDFLYQAVPAKLLQTEIDTCWVKYAGVDPAAYLIKYKNRAPVVHIKDFVGFKGETSPYHLIGQAENPDASIAQFSYRPLGQGVQDLPAIVNAAKEAGASWLIIEQDESPDRPALEASAISIEFLKQII